MTLNALEQTVKVLINKSISRGKVSSTPVVLPILNLKAAVKASVGNIKHDKYVQQFINSGWTAEEDVGWVWYRNPGGYITWVARWYQGKGDKIYIVYTMKSYEKLIGDMKWPIER